MDGQFGASRVLQDLLREDDAGEMPLLLSLLKGSARLSAFESSKSPYTYPRARLYLRACFSWRAEASAEAFYIL